MCMICFISLVIGLAAHEMTHYIFFRMYGIRVSQICFLGMYPEYNGVGWVWADKKNVIAENETLPRIFEYVVEVISLIIFIYVFDEELLNKFKR